MSLEQQPKPEQPSSVENHTTHQVEPKTTAQKELEETPSTTREQFVEIVKGLTSRDNSDVTAHNFLLRVVQPGLAGLMDGSVSTLAPIFATAFATHIAFTTFLVGMASATGAGISMAFSEALSDDGQLTGRGSPVIRGGITGLMTFFGGALHTLPFLIPNVHIALYVAYIVVAVELVIISAIRHRYFGTSWWLSIVQVVGSGILVFAAAFIFGSA
jgi:VIT1/CCC1 family predicted Fe2+/Mn2+ transporter